MSEGTSGTRQANRIHHGIIDKAQKYKRHAPPPKLDPLDVMGDRTLLGHKKTLTQVQKQEIK